MAIGTNRWKLGLFVLLGMALAVAALVLFGVKSWNEKTVTYVSFFDESVQGLDPGSPVKFRGVTIGRVAAIDVAPDHRHVAVELDLSVEQIERLNLGVLRDPAKARATSSTLRVQLAQTGLTGVKFMLLDFFDGTRPAPVLPFPAPKNTLPTEPSTMKNLEASVVRAADRFPEIADALLGSINRVNRMLDGLDQEGLPARANATLGNVDLTVSELRAQIKALRMNELSAKTEQNLAQLDQTLKGIDRLVARVDGKDGLMSNAERATNSLNEVARGAQTVGPEMELTLREVRGAARSIRRLADVIERDPDMLLKGRATAAAP